MLKVGSVVRSAAGHDKDKFYVITALEQHTVWIADGKLRKLEKPKRKNIRHIRKTNTVLDWNVVTTNRQLRLALKAFEQAPAAAEEGGN